MKGDDVTFELSRIERAKKKKRGKECVVSNVGNVSKGR